MYRPLLNLKVRSTSIIIQLKGSFPDLDLRRSYRLESLPERQILLSQIVLIDTDFVVNHSGRPDIVLFLYQVRRFPFLRI